MYKKNEFSFENVSMLLAYLLEKEYHFSLRHRVVILFDMSDSGYSNTVISLPNLLKFNFMFLARLFRLKRKKEQFILISSNYLAHVSELLIFKVKY